MPPYRNHILSQWLPTRLEKRPLTAAAKGGLSLTGEARVFARQSNGPGKVMANPFGHGRNSMTAIWP
jgi:hypothetical protein